MTSIIAPIQKQLQQEVNEGALLTLDKIIAEKINDIQMLHFLARGKNLNGVFQLYKQGTLKIIKELVPILIRRFEKYGFVSIVEVAELVSIITTIIRPSSRNSGATDRLIAKAKFVAENEGKTFSTKIGDKVVSYPWPEKFDAFSRTNHFYPLFYKYTKDTYGELIYQEQLMDLINELFQLSDLGKSDIYRRYFESSDENKINKIKEEYKLLYADKGILNKHMREFWLFLVSVAGYSFNKSHAVSYTLISLATAFLKANPMLTAYYISSCIAGAKADATKKRLEKIDDFVNDAIFCGIKVLMPRFNNVYSVTTPDIDKPIIYLSPDVINGIGPAVSSVLASKNDFTSIDDFLHWSYNQVKITKNELGKETSHKVFSKTTYKILAQSGFFEDIEYSDDVWQEGAEPPLTPHEIVDYLNSYEFIKEEYRQMTYNQKEKTWKYNCKNNAELREELIETYLPEEFNPKDVNNCRNLNVNCKVRVFTPLLKKNSKIEPLKGDKIEWELEMLTFLLTNPLLPYEHLLESCDEYSEGLIFIKKCLPGSKIGDRGLYEWTRLEVIWDSEHSKFPQSVFISNKQLKLKFGEVYKVKYTVKYGFNYIESVNIKDYKLVDIVR
jgi:hypothetical protein